MVHAIIYLSSSGMFFIWSSKSSPAVFIMFLKRSEALKIKSWKGTEAVLISLYDKSGLKESWRIVLITCSLSLSTETSLNPSRNSG